MNSRHLLFVAAAAVVAAGAWVVLRPPEAVPAGAGAASRSASGGDSSRVSSSGAGARFAQAPAAGREQARVPLTPPPPTLFNEYLGARQYRILYDRLAESPEGQSAEGSLVLYEILRQCATVTDGPRPGWKANPPRREDFIRTIPANDPLRDKRIAAFDEFALDRCKGFEGMSVRHADLMKLLEDAAARGSAQARALAIEQELGRPRRGGTQLDDARIQALREAAQTRDPEAIRVAGRVLGNAWPDYSLRIGPDQQAIEQRAFVNAFLVLSCEFGAPCGADTPRMLEACALRGHCNAQNFPDYLAYYGSTPHDAQMTIQYREIVRHAILTGDWSQIAVVRGPPNHRMSFVPGPR